MTKMTNTMHAVVCHGPRDYRVETIPVPEPSPGEYLIESVAVLFRFGPRSGL
jgi:hypothetical protein